MGWFDNEDEEKKAPTEPMGPPVSAAKDPVVRDYLMKKYAQASDTSGVDTARQEADDTATNMGIMTGIGQMLTAKGKSRGGAGFDDSVFKSLAANARTKVGDAQQARRDQMDNVLAEDKIQQQGVDRDRATEEYGWKKGEQEAKVKDRTSLSDPASSTSRAATAAAIPRVNSLITEATRANASPQHIEQLQTLSDDLKAGKYSAGDISKMGMLDKADYKDILNNNAAMARIAAQEAGANKRAKDHQAGEDRRTTNMHFSQEKTLRDQIEKDPQIVGAVTTSTNLNKISELLSRETGPADEALGMVWQKGLDPISVVRESEFARTNEGQSLLGKAEALWGKASNGTRFTPELRAEMKNVMGEISKGNGRYIDSKLKATESSILQYGLNRANVIPEYIDALRGVPKAAPAQAGDAPAAGQTPTPAAPTSLSPEKQAILDKAKAAVANPEVDAETKASAQKVIDKLSK